MTQRFNVDELCVELAKCLADGGHNGQIRVVTSFRGSCPARAEPDRARLRYHRVYMDGHFSSRGIKIFVAVSVCHSRANALI